LGSIEITRAMLDLFSHELLDCLLLKSAALRNAWVDALAASMERSELTTADDKPLQALFRAATHCDLTKNKVHNSQKILDAVTVRPSWSVPCP
jgi:hypothetical protein